MSEKVKAYPTEVVDVEPEYIQEQETSIVKVDNDPGAIIPRSKQELEVYRQQTAIMGDYLAAARERTVYLMKSLFPGDLVAFKGQDGNYTVEISGPGAYRLAPMIGISVIGVTKQKVEHDDEGGKWVEYIYNGTAVHGERKHTIRSVDHTRNPFWCKAKGTTKPFHEIDQVNVEKSAFYGLYKQAVRIHTGIKRMPLEVVLKELKIEERLIKKVGFDGSGGGSSKTGSATAPAGEIPKCDKCGKPMKYRTSAKGNFWGCSGYPECKNTQKADGNATPSTKTTPASKAAEAPQGDTRTDEDIRGEIWSLVMEVSENDQAAAVKYLSENGCKNLNLCVGGDLDTLLEKVTSDHADYINQK